MIFSSLPSSDIKLSKYREGKNFKIVIQDSEFINLTYEGGYSFFELTSKNVTLSNITFKDIAKYDVLKEPLWRAANYNIELAKTNYGLNR